MNQIDKDKFFAALTNFFNYLNKYLNGSQIFNKASYNKVSNSNSKIYNDILALKVIDPDLQFKFEDFNQDVVRLLFLFKQNFIL
jgi:hypothetical protein